MLTGDIKILWSLLRGQPTAPSHAARLQDFYRDQAADYDRFRERLLSGRAELIDQLAFAPRTRVVELGAGTGRNIEYFASRIPQLHSVDLVDLCPALLAQAQLRTMPWSNVNLIEADVIHYRPAVPVDYVYFSYSLTMIPDWFRAIDNAIAMLRPGGILGVVDFYIARAYPADGRARHSGWSRAWWPLWFAYDGVHLSSDHLPYLASRLFPLYVYEGVSTVPYLPGLRVPYYIFIGRRV